MNQIPLKLNQEEVRADLYLTAILPSDNIAQREAVIKRKIAEVYGTKVAVSKPAHITVIKTFQATPMQLNNLIGAYKEVVEHTAPFEIYLNGTGFFGNHTVFIKADKSEELDQFYDRLKFALHSKGLPKQLGIRFDKLNPHMTIAYRDLTSETFEQIWNEYKDLKFTAQFTADKLYLLKYVNYRWERFLHFDFKGIRTAVTQP